MFLILRLSVWCSMRKNNWASCGQNFIRKSNWFNLNSLLRQWCFLWTSFFTYLDWQIEYSVITWRQSKKYDLLCVFLLKPLALYLAIGTEIRKVKLSNLELKSNDTNHDMKGIPLFVTQHPLLEYPRAIYLFICLFIYLFSIYLTLAMKIYN